MDDFDFKVVSAARDQNQENNFELTKSAHSSELVYSLGDNEVSAASLNANTPQVILTDEKKVNAHPDIEM